MNSQSPKWYSVGLIFGVLVFWALRGSYWLQIHELPFSDMADFERIALGILSNFSFEHDPFWKSYKSPTLPVLGALVWAVSGLKNYFAWRVFQSTFLLLGLLWLTREMRLSTRTRWIPLLLLWIVALSKPSIFWSYKYATESVAEALLYFSSAATLCAYRSGLLLPAFLAGAFCTISVLNRPNYAVCIPLAGLLMLFARSASAQRRFICSRGVLMAAVFSLGVLVLWAPWVYRTYNLYGAALLTNTSGGHSLIFDLGTIHVTLPDGTVVDKSNNDLLREARARFTNDYESHLHAREIFKAWLAQDPQRYLDLVWFRFKATLTEHSVFLTTVSRTELFGGPLDSVLPDKSIFLVAFGFLSLTGLALHYGIALIVLPWVAVVPWLAAILVANTSRYLDPMIPLLTFGTALGIGAIALRLPSLLRCGRLRAVPVAGH